MNRIAFGLSCLVCLGVFSLPAAALSPACSISPPPLRVHRDNIFNEQQEQWLGDALADMVEPHYDLEPEAQSAYLAAIGQKLVAALPPTGIHYTFRIFESADMRAFSLAGGHVYISRKLVLDARNEDELAAMLAQEVGRVYIHHSASVATLRMRRMLGVKQVGDQADVVDKFQRLLNIPVPVDAQLGQSAEEKDELLADRVGLYAMIKAGYAPEAFAAFLDRVNLNGGYTGSFFSDLLEMTPEVSVRVRQAHKVVSALPNTCRLERPQFRPGFKPFQQATQDQRIDPIVEATPGLKSVALAEPMMPALETVRLSADGRHALAQDQMQIHVLEAYPPKLLFSIDARDAEPAQFTPDSKSVVFYYDSLRVEKWDVAAQKPEGVLDFPDYAGCPESSLSPDGNLFACVSHNNNYLWLRLIDLQTGNVIFQNMKFHDTNFTLREDFLPPMRLADLLWSPDDRYFLAVAGSDRVAIDLTTRRPVPVQGALSDIYQGRMAFIGSNTLVFGCDWTSGMVTMIDGYQMCDASFPGGKPVKKFRIGFQWIGPVTNGPWILRGPYDRASARLFDPLSGKVEQSFTLDPVDVEGEQVAEEAPYGGLATGKLGEQLRVASLPVTALQYIESGAFSEDGRYVAYSDRARGGVWDVQGGKRIQVTGAFRSAQVDESGHLHAVVLDQELKPSIHTEVDWRTHKMVRQVTVGGTEMQFGNELIATKLTDPNGFLNDALMQGFDAKTGAKLWSKHFGNGTPVLMPADGDHLLMITGWSTFVGSNLTSHSGVKLVRTSDEDRWKDAGDCLVAVVNAKTGLAEYELLAPEMGDDGATQRSAALFGDLLAVRGNRNNTVVYRAEDGKRLMAFFGRALAGDQGMGMIASTNRLQELNVYDVASGKQVMHVTLDQAPLVARFLPQRKQLLVLTGSQRVFFLDLPDARTGKEHAAN